MNTRISVYLIISLFISGCGAIATPTSIPIQAIPTLSPLDQATPTATVFIPTLATATIESLEQTNTPQPTDTIPVLQMEIVEEPEQTSIPQPTACQSPPRNWVAYTVQRNDTLSSLGQRTGTSWQQIQAANCLASTTIFAGQRIYLPFVPIPPPAVTQQPNIESPEAPPPGDPRIDVDPGSGPAGTTFTLKIRDFDKFEVITVKVESSDETGTTIDIDSFPVTMDEDGKYDYPWISPTDLAIGFYAVKPFRSDNTQGDSGTIVIVP